MSFGLCVAHQHSSTSQSDVNEGTNKTENFLSRLCWANSSNIVFCSPYGDYVDYVAEGACNVFKTHWFGCFVCVLCCERRLRSSEYSKYTHTMFVRSVFELGWFVPKQWLHSIASYRMSWWISAKMTCICRSPAWQYRIAFKDGLEWNCEMWRQNKNPAWHCRMCRALLSGSGQCFTDMNVMHFRVRIRIVRGIYKIEIKSPRRHVIYCQDFFFSLHSPHTAIMLCSTPLCFRHCWLCRIWSSILSESLLLKSVLTPTAVDIGAICQLDFSWYGDDGCLLSNAGVNDDDDDETLQKSEKKKTWQGTWYHSKLRQ